MSFTIMLRELKTCPIQHQSVKNLKDIDRLIVFALVQLMKQISGVSREFNPTNEIARPNKLELKTRLDEPSVMLTNENGNDYNFAPKYYQACDTKSCLIAQHRNFEIDE